VSLQGCLPRLLAWQPQTVNMQRLQVAGSGCRCRCRLLSKAACLAATNCQYAAAAGCRFRLQVQVQVAFQGGLLGSHKLPICSGCRLQVQVAGAGAGCFPRRLAWQPQTVNMQRLQVAGSGCRCKCRCRLLSKAACLAATNAVNMQRLQVQATLGSVPHDSRKVLNRLLCS
jgi:hypothetical protein